MGVMETRKALAQTFVADKAACVAVGDYAGLRKLMELTDDILSGRHDMPKDAPVLTDDELLAELLG